MQVTLSHNSCKSNLRNIHVSTTLDTYLHFRYREHNIEFDHTFTLINQGPSYTNEPKTLFLFFPKSNLVSLKSNISELCAKHSATPNTLDNPIPEEKNSIGCGSKPCLVFQCTIPKNWPKDQDYTFELNAEFNATVANEVEESDFSIYTMISMDDQESHTMTKVSENALGAIERLAQNWPIVLGVGLGLLIVIGTILILHKTGMLAKMNPYKLDEQEVKAERRKSRMRISRMSVRYSEVPNQEQ